MKKLLSLILSLCLMSSMGFALAETPGEALSVTHHTAEIAGQTLSYTATAGRLTVGRLDGRMTGPLTQGSIADGEADPSASIVDTAFGNTVNQYLAGELDYHTDLLYDCLGDAPYKAWKYNQDNRFLDQKETIYNIMSRNSFLKVWVLCGYYDLATPFFAAEWVYDHVFLNAENQDNLRFTYYPSGHMIYMYRPSLEQFRKDAEEWYR